MKKRVVNKMLALLMSVMMCAGACPGFSVNAQEVTGRAAHSLKNPDGDVNPNASGSEVIRRQRLLSRRKTTQKYIKAR